MHPTVGEEEGRHDMQVLCWSEEGVRHNRRMEGQNQGVAPFDRTFEYV